MGYYQGDYYAAGAMPQLFGGALRAPTLSAVKGIAKNPKLRKLGGRLVRKGLGKLRGRMKLGGVRHHRRMNPGNFKALTRSLRRIKRFEHAARKVLHITRGHATHTRFKFGRKHKR